MIQQKLKNVAAQQNQLELIATRLKSCCGFLKESLRTGSQVEILAMGKPFVEQVQDVVTSFKPESLKPEEQANLLFLSNQNELSRVCQQFGQVITSPVCHKKCNAQGDGLKLAVVGEAASATVQVVGQEREKYEYSVEMCCELVSCDGSRRVKGEVMKMREDQYKISYLPNSVSSQLNDPCGVTLSANEDIVVANQRNHRIQVFSPDGKSVKCVGTKGSGPQQFNYPVGIALHPHSKKIYIADAGNHKVQVLNEDFTFHKTIGSSGSDNGQFNNPLDINFDNSGNMYVADTCNKRVQVFSEDGEYIWQFKNKKSSNINGIALDSNNLVYISDNENNISVFTQEGHFLKSFQATRNSPGPYCGCTGITVSRDGVIYVSDHNNSHIQVF